jgi:hypothetical protein
MDLIKPITTDHDLIKLADTINVHLNEILDINEIKKPLSKGSYLILLRSDLSIGHWVAQYNNEYFDSMGVGPPVRLGKLKYNETQYQGAYSEFCGIWSMLWLYSKQKNKPELLNGFKDLDIDTIDGI